MDVRKSEIFGYIGPNGAGKTTTIKTIVGLARPSEGSVALEGRPLGPGSEYLQRKVGYLPQSAAFQGWKSVEDALTTFGGLSGVSRTELRRRIPEVLAELRIPEVRFRKIAELSGGTVQKVGLAQAILHRPALLVLDEPMAPLDPESRFQFKEILLGLRKEGTTILFSSHILRDVQDIADRIGILHRGRVLFVGTFAQLQARMSIPNDIRVDLSVGYREPLSPDLLGQVLGIEASGPASVLVHLPPAAEVGRFVALLFDGFRDSGYQVRAIYPVVPDLEQTYVRFVEGSGT